MERLCRDLGIAEVADLGSPLPGMPAILGQTRVESKGVLSSEEILSLLSDSVAGFISFPLPEYFAKSSVFAAYCASGLLTAVGPTAERTVDGLVPGRHYWAYDRPHPKLDWPCALMIAENARNWYQDHCLARQAEKIHAMMENGVPV